KINSAEHLLEQAGFPVPEEIAAYAIIPKRELARYTPVLLPPHPRSLVQLHGDSVSSTRIPAEIRQSALREIAGNVPSLKAHDQAVTDWVEFWQTRRDGTL